MARVELRWIGAIDVDSDGYGSGRTNIAGYTVEVDLELEDACEVPTTEELDWLRVAPNQLWSGVSSRIRSDARSDMSEVQAYLQHHAREIGRSFEIHDIIPLSLGISGSCGEFECVLDCGLGFDLSQYVLAFNFSCDGEILGVSFES